jgi:hypothetical protein
LLAIAAAMPAAAAQGSGPDPARLWPGSEQARFFAARAINGGDRGAPAAPRRPGPRKTTAAWRGLRGLDRKPPPRRRLPVQKSRGEGGSRRRLQKAPLPFSPSLGAERRKPAGRRARLSKNAPAGRGGERQSRPMAKAPRRPWRQRLEPWRGAAAAARLRRREASRSPG